MVAHTDVSADGELATETNEHLGSRRGVGVAVVVNVLIDEDRAFRDRGRVLQHAEFRDLRAGEQLNRPMSTSLPRGAYMRTFTRPMNWWRMLSTPLATPTGS